MTENEENKDKPEQPSKKQKKGIKKKIRSSKKIKNTLGDFNIYHQNVRGLKSKIDSLGETIDDYVPTLISLVEIRFTKQEQIQIPWNKIFSNDGTTNSRGILITIKEKLKSIVVQGSKQGRENWSNTTGTIGQKTQVRMRVIYGPQEKVTPNSQLKKWYESIPDQVNIGKENKQ